MRISHVQLAGYAPAQRGGPKANRSLLDALAARGHACRATVPLEASPSNLLQTSEQLADGGVALHRLGDGRQLAVVADVELDVFDPATGPDVAWGVRHSLAEHRPDVVLVDGTDINFAFLEAALEHGAPVVYVSHHGGLLPFGPIARFENPRGTELIRRCCGVITVSTFMQEYIRRWGGIESEVLRFPVFGEGPFPALGRFGEGRVTLINPGAFKGIQVLLGLAATMPEVRFGAVPNTWDTSPDELEALQRVANIDVLPRSYDLDALFASTTVLLAPSIGPEAFGLVVVEAMLRGIPVLGSDQGGIPEAKLGVDYVLPVQPMITSRNEFGMLIAEAPEAQDVGPWATALRHLLENQASYERLADASQRAAHEFVEGARADPFEEVLGRWSSGRG